MIRARARTASYPVDIISVLLYHKLQGAYARVDSFFISIISEMKTVGEFRASRARVLGWRERRLNVS